MEKRYQVFVSSTFADLKDERQRVIQTLMGMDCIPAGMELFGAADEAQLQFIRRVIDDCDYYLLIIGGRYGSLTADGISFTEAEYDYAVSKGMKVLALVHEQPDLIPVGKSDSDATLREKLNSFRTKVQTGRLVVFWTEAKDLPGLVAINLPKLTKTHPAVGWVRANAVANSEVLAQINELRLQNDQLRTELASMTATPPVSLEDVAGLDEAVKLRVACVVHKRERELPVSVTWREVFGFVGPYLVKPEREEIVKKVLGKAVADKAAPGCFVRGMEDQDFKTVGVQLKVLGLVKVEVIATGGTGSALTWSLTPQGERLMYETRVVRTDR